MKRGLVIGTLWEAHAIAKHLSLPCVSLSEANKDMLKQSRFVIAADDVPDTNTLSRWTWGYRMLALRVAYHASYWLQLSNVDVLAGNEYNRPYRSSDIVNPRGVNGMVMAALESSLRSLSYKVSIVRKSVLLGEPFIEWANRIVASEVVVEPILMSPTNIYDFADHLVEIAEDEREGVMHLANNGYATYKEILELLLAHQFGMRVEVDEAPTKQLNLAVTSGHRLRDWPCSIIDLAKK